MSYQEIMSVPSSDKVIFRKKLNLQSMPLYHFHRVQQIPAKAAVGEKRLSHFH